MPLDTLLAALAREARATAARLLSEARDEAARLSKAADASIARRRDVSVTARIQELRAAMEQVLGEATRQARGEVLRARERLMARVFRTVRASLPAVATRPDYRGLLSQEVSAALTCVGPQEAAIIRCPTALLPIVREAAAARPAIVVQPDDAAGCGFRLVTTDGVIEVDGTLETRIEASTASLARTALRQLDGST